jgi:hypothetical protein
MGRTIVKPAAANGKREGAASQRWCARSPAIWKLVQSAQVSIREIWVDWEAYSTNAGARGIVIPRWLDRITLALSQRLRLP